MRKRSRLAHYLKESRIKANLSQAEVATSLRYSTPQFISNWERGVSSPPLDKMNELIVLYQLSPTQTIEIMIEETRAYLEENISLGKENA